MDIFAGYKKSSAEDFQRLVGVNMGAFSRITKIMKFSMN